MEALAKYSGTQIQQVCNKWFYPNEFVYSA